MIPTRLITLSLAAYVVIVLAGIDIVRIVSALVFG